MEVGQRDRRSRARGGVAGEDRLPPEGALETWSRTRANSLVTDDVDLVGVQVARTLIRRADLRARLRVLPAGDWRATLDLLVTTA